MTPPREKYYRFGIDPAEVTRQLRQLADKIDKQGAVLQQVTTNTRRKGEEFEFCTMVIKYARKR